MRRTQAPRDAELRRRRLTCTARATPPGLGRERCEIRNPLFDIYLLVLRLPPNRRGVLAQLLR